MAVAEPLILRWQGILSPQAEVVNRLERLAGVLLIVLFAGLPVLTRTGLALLIAASGALWVLWSLCTPPPERLGPISN